MRCKKIQIVKDLRCLWLPKFRGSIVGSVMAYICTSCLSCLCWCNKNVLKTFQNTNLVHNSFNLQQYICYTTLLNVFRAARCSSSGGPIVSPQPLVSSPSVSSRTVCRWRADCSPLSTRVLYGCSKHVEERSVTYILLKNKRIVH